MNKIIESGTVKMLIYAFLYSIVAVLVKFLSEDMDTFSIVFWRCLLPIPFLYCLLKTHNISLKPNLPFLMSIRLVLSVSSMILTFWAFSQLPLADAMLIGRFQPVFVALLAPIFLSEKPSIVVILTLILSLTGVFLVLEPTLEVGNWAGCAALLGAACNGAGHVVVRSLTTKESPLLIVIWLSIATSVVLAPAVLAPIAVFTTAAFNTAMIDPISNVLSERVLINVLLIGLLAFTATLAQWVLTLGYKTENAPAAAAATYSSIVFAVLWGLLFWQEIPSMEVLIGGSIICFAGISLIIYRTRAIKTTMTTSYS